MTIEPVAWLRKRGGYSHCGHGKPPFPSDEPLYAAEALAAAWEQGRTASAEAIALGDDFPDEDIKAHPAFAEFGEVLVDTIRGSFGDAADAIRALRNPHGRT